MVVSKFDGVVAPSLSGPPWTDTSTYEYVGFWWLPFTLDKGVRCAWFPVFNESWYFYPCSYDEPGASYTKLYEHRNKKPKTNTEGSVTPGLGDGEDSGTPTIGEMNVEMNAGDIPKNGYEDTCGT